MGNKLLEKLNDLLRYMNSKKKTSTEFELRKNKYAQKKIKSIIQKIK